MYTSFVDYMKSYFSTCDAESRQAIDEYLNARLPRRGKEQEDPKSPLKVFLEAAGYSRDEIRAEYNQKTHDLVIFINKEDHPINGDHKFVHTIAVDQHLDEDRINITMVDGLLTIEIPVKTEAEQDIINIKVE